MIFLALALKWLYFNNMQVGNVYNSKTELTEAIRETIQGRIVELVRMLKDLEFEKRERGQSYDLSRRFKTIGERLSDNEKLYFNVFDSEYIPVQ